MLDPRIRLLIAIQVDCQLCDSAADLGLQPQPHSRALLAYMQWPQKSGQLQGFAVLALTTAAYLCMSWHALCVCCWCCACVLSVPAASCSSATCSRRLQPCSAIVDMQE